MKIDGPHGKVSVLDNDGLRELVTPARVALVVMAQRIGARSFVTFLEHTHFPPATELNRHFRFAVVQFGGIYFFVVIIHKMHLEKADKLMALLGLRRADGIPHLAHGGGGGELVWEKFPLDGSNVWTLENVPGHFTYGNDRDLEAKARAFEDQACEQLAAEHDRRLAAGEFDCEPGTPPVRRL